MDSVANRRDRMKLFVCLKPTTIDYEGKTVAVRHDQHKCVRENDNKNRIKSGQSLSSGLKAVFVNSFLGKKFRTNKSRKAGSLCQARMDMVVSPKHKMKKASSYNKFSDTEQVFTSSNSRNSSNTASSRSSISSNFLGSERHLYLDSSEFNKQQLESATETTTGRRFVCIGSIRNWCMFMFVVCLFALVFVGKPFAILTCTTMCLFFAPRYKRVNRDSVLVSKVTDSDEYKKRVIMEGLLDRNRPTRVS